MTDIDPFALSYTYQHADEIEAALQEKVDTHKGTEKSDPLNEVLRLAQLTGGANATSDPEAIKDEETKENLRKLEIARNAAYIAGVSKII